MKKLATLFLALMIGGIAFGQERQRGQQRTPEENAKASTERLASQLKLTADQQKKVYDLSLERAKKAKDQAPIERGKMDEAKMKEMREERKAYQDKLESILTPEQVKTLNESRATAIKDRSERGNRAPRAQKEKAPADE